MRTWSRWKSSTSLWTASNTPAGDPCASVPSTTVVGALGVGVLGWCVVTAVWTIFTFSLRGLCSVFGVRDLCRTCSAHCWLRKWIRVLHPLFLACSYLECGQYFFGSCICQLRVRGWSCLKRTGIWIFWEMTPGFGPVFSILRCSTAATRLCQSTEAVVFFTRFLCEGGLAPVVHGDFGMNFNIFLDEKWTSILRSIHVPRSISCVRRCIIVGIRTAWHPQRRSCSPSRSSISSSWYAGRFPWSLRPWRFPSCTWTRWSIPLLQVVYFFPVVVQRLVPWFRSLVRPSGFPNCFTQ